MNSLPTFCLYAYRCFITEKPAVKTADVRNASHQLMYIPPLTGIVAPVT